MDTLKYNIHDYITEQNNIKLQNRISLKYTKNNIKLRNRMSLK